MNHDAISVQMCFNAGLSEADTDALLTRLKERAFAQTRRDSRQLRALCEQRDFYHRTADDRVARIVELEAFAQHTKVALDRMERTAAGHSIGADKADDATGYQGGFAAGFMSCLNVFREALK